MFFAAVPLDVLTVWMGEASRPPALWTRSAAARAGDAQLGDALRDLEIERGV